MGTSGTNAFTGQPYPLTGHTGFGQFADTGVMYIGSGTRVADVSDGLSNTFLIGELSWTAAGLELATKHYRPTKRLRLLLPEPALSANSVRNGAGNVNDISFGSEHPGGTQFLLGDGSVSFLSENTLLKILQAAATRHMAEPPQLP